MDDETVEKTDITFVINMSVSIKKSTKISDLIQMASKNWNVDKDSIKIEVNNAKYSEKEAGGKTYSLLAPNDFNNFSFLDKCCVSHVRENMDKSTKSDDSWLFNTTQLPSTGWNTRASRVNSNNRTYGNMQWGNSNDLIEGSNSKTLGGFIQPIREGRKIKKSKESNSNIFNEKSNTNSCKNFNPFL